MDTYSKSKKNNIGFVGNCQAIALCWYFRRLVKNNCYFVNSVFIGERYPRNEDIFLDQTRYNIYDQDEGIKYLKSCKVIVYQKIKPTTHEVFNYKKIEEYASSDAKLISFPTIWYNDQDKDISSMQDREVKLNISLKVSEIISRNLNRKLMITENCTKPDHPNSYLFLEIVREICNIINVNFFNKEDYFKYLNFGYPFG